jgi:hypothetical protein
MTEVTGEIDNSSYEWTIRERAFTCDNCGRMNMLSDMQPAQVSYSVRGPRGRTEWSPRHGETREFPDVPEHIAAAATEASLCLSVGAFRAVGSLARAVIEATAKDKRADGRNLEKRIDALYDDNHIRPHTKDQAHEVRHFGNDMAHGDFADPVTQEEAEEIFELMVEVLDEVYQSPARLEKRRTARLAKESEES